MKKTKNLKERILSIVLTLSMIVSLAVGMAPVNAHAEGETATVTFATYPTGGTIVDLGEDSIWVEGNTVKYNIPDDEFIYYTMLVPLSALSSSDPNFTTKTMATIGKAVVDAPANVDIDNAGQYINGSGDYTVFTIVQGCNGGTIQDLPLTMGYDHSSREITQDSVAVIYKLHKDNLVKKRYTGTNPYYNDASDVYLFSLYGVHMEEITVSGGGNEGGNPPAIDVPLGTVVNLKDELGEDCIRIEGNTVYFDIPSEDERGDYLYYTDAMSVPSSYPETVLNNLLSSYLSSYTSKVGEEIKNLTEYDIVNDSETIKGIKALYAVTGEGWDEISPPQFNKLTDSTSTKTVAFIFKVHKDNYLFGKFESGQNPYNTELGRSFMYQYGVYGVYATIVDPNAGEKSNYTITLDRSNYTTDDSLYLKVYDKNGTIQNYISSNGATATLQKDGYLIVGSKSTGDFEVFVNGTSSTISEQVQVEGGSEWYYNITDITNDATIVVKPKTSDGGGENPPAAEGTYTVTFDKTGYPEDDCWATVNDFKDDSISLENTGDQATVDADSGMWVFANEEFKVTAEGATIVIPVRPNAEEGASGYEALISEFTKDTTIVVSKINNDPTPDEPDTPSDTSVVIKEHPQDVTVKVGETATFSVTVSGSAISYQWRVSKDGGKSFTDIAGATSATYTISGVKTSDAGLYRCRVSNDGGEGVETLEATLTVTADSTGGNPGDSNPGGGNSGGGSGYHPPVGGGSSSGGSTGGTQITVPVKNPETAVNVTAKVEENKATVDAIKDEDLAKVTNTKEETTIEIDLTGLDKTIDTVVIPKESMEKISKAASDTANEVEGLTIKLSTATVTLDATALSAVVGQADGDNIQLNVDDVHTGRLNTTQMKAVEKLDVHKGVEAYFTCNGRRIGDFKGGEVKVELPFEVPIGYNPAGFSVWYVDDNGNTTKYKSNYKDGKLSFVVDHFSDFIVVYDAADVEVNTAFHYLRLRGKETTEDSIKLVWNTVEDADGYVLYGNKCNANGKKYTIKKIKTIKDGDVSKLTVKDLEEGTYYKYYIKAYKLVDGKKVILGKSKTIHVTTDGGKYGNAKAVKVNATEVTLKAGETFAIKAEQLKKDKPIAKHTTIKFESNKSTVAKVNKNGTVTAKKKGTAIIYVYAQNGVYEKVKVTVK